MDLKTQPNEKRCENTTVTHKLSLPQCCPISGNPQPGSSVEITYFDGPFFLEVAALREYIDSFVGGRGTVRSMEGMIQQIAQDCSDCVGQTVTVVANLIIEPMQSMTVVCTGRPQ